MKPDDDESERFLEKLEKIWLDLGEIAVK